MFLEAIDQIILFSQLSGFLSYSTFASLKVWLLDYLQKLRNQIISTQIYWTIGVAVGKFVGVGRIFARISPNLT